MAPPPTAHQPKPQCNQVLPGDSSRCTLPSGHGTQHPGTGPCYYHERVEMTSGDETVMTTQRAVRGLERTRKTFRYQMSTDSRLGCIMNEMGAELVMHEDQVGVATVDLDWELKCVRALNILHFERYGEREEAFLSWARAYEAGDTKLQPPRPPAPDTGHRMILAVAALAKTMHDMEQSVPAGKFFAILKEMADVVNDLVADRSVRSEIQRRWLAITAEFVV